MKQCHECKKRGKTWNGSDPICAFKNLEFSNDNWNCATINIIRDLIDSDFHAGCFGFRDDMDNASIGVIPLPSKCDESGYLVMTWYKERGRVGMAIIVNDDDNPKPLTRKTASQIIKYYSKYIKP